MVSNGSAELIGAATSGDRAALARLLTIVERGEADAHVIRRWAQQNRAHTWVIGMTGVPGAGKSTLTSALVRAIRIAAPADAVAVLAVDPSSPFTGGALLGDRVRMDQHFDDPKVMIRSMATRGQRGGLSLAVPAAVRVLGAAGFTWVIVETVGVGQIELDVAAHADTVLVVLHAGWGDSMQTSKAGLLEIADVLVVNKADVRGADQVRVELETLGEHVDSARPRAPIVSTIALTGAGVDELWSAIIAHRARAVSDGSIDARRASGWRDEVRQIMLARVEELLSRSSGSADGHLRDDPHLAAARLMAELWSDVDSVQP